MECCKTLVSWATSPATPATKKKIDKSRLNELDSSTLVELIKDYMGENQSLRRENGDLFSVRDMMLRLYLNNEYFQQKSQLLASQGPRACLPGERAPFEEVGGRQLVSFIPQREGNEDNLRVCCRSPIIPARPSYSAELMSLSYSGSLPRSSVTLGSDDWKLVTIESSGHLRVGSGPRRGLPASIRISG